MLKGISVPSRLSVKHVGHGPDSLAALVRGCAEDPELGNPTYGSAK